MGTLQKCADTAARCLQAKPSDPTCLPKAHERCTQLRAKLVASQIGAEAKLSGAIVAACDQPSLSLSELLAASGLGERATVCGALGVGPLDSVTAVADCIARLHACRADQVIEAQTPRLEEMLQLTE
jgi:hypothetical protein